MNNVAGPYDQLDFRTMKKYKDSLEFYKTKPLRYANAAKREKSILKEYLTRGSA